VRSGSTKQTDRLRFNYDCRLSSLEACNGPLATTVASSTTTGGNGSSTGFKGAGNSCNRRRRFGTRRRRRGRRLQDDCFGRLKPVASTTLPQ
jgi:hypothetical protein